ncbi:thioredoxin family protein [Chitinispirillales bacterium ANBcel5]|uniref:protein-disulfide reductase DsbD family protein n=1 Tax=Cellulosispirillum alkaliphilum TaxID=3039283 RepID=UPI002A57B43D|nr:thioredoxin family protein [Chitinispirillales bacterium ANBcel5]
MKTRVDSMYLKSLFVTTLLLLLNVSFYATGEQIEVSISPDRAHYSSLDTAIVSVKVSIPPNHYLYANPLGPGIGRPLEFSVSQSEGIHWVEVKSDKPEKFHPPVGDWVWAYENTAFFFLKGVIEPDFLGMIEGSVTIDALICDKACVPVKGTAKFNFGVKQHSSPERFSNTPSSISRYKEAVTMDFKTADQQAAIQPSPGQTQLSLSLEGLDAFVENDAVETETAPPHEWSYTPVENRRDFNLIIALLFSFLAGIALNITPCVFPLLGMKALSLSQGASENRKETIKRSISFSAGIIFVFLLLASLASFAGFSWGEQFQNPKIVAVIIAFVFLFALGMFDLYTILLPPSITNLGQGGGKSSDFFKGMMATVLATPCGGPFLGAVLAWALLQPTLLIFLIFLTIGVGMALPYILLSSIKSLVKILPKPGRWMQDFKHLMGFFLLGFAIYLMTTLPSEMIISVVILCTVLAFSVLIYRRFAPFSASASRKAKTAAFSLLIIILGINISFKSMGVSDTPDTPQPYTTVSLDELIGEQWVDFTPSRLIEAHESNKNVIVNFTADWCMNCRLNKIMVFETEEVKQLFREKNVVLLSADITRSNPRAEELLHHLGSRSIPFLAVFPASSPQEPIILRDIINKDNFLEILNDL